MKLRDIFSAGDAILKANILNKKTPFSVVFSITNRCNFRCRYCGIWERNDEGEMTTEQIFSLIDELAELGTKRFGLFGGEPLLRDDVGEVIDYAKKKGMYTSLDSNGYLVSERIDEIKNVDKLILSFDGPEKIHDKLKKKGSYKKLMEGIKAANDYKIPMWTVTVLTKYNTNPEPLDFILEKAKELGFYTYYQILLHTPRMAKGTENLLPPDEEHRKAVKKLIEEKEKGEPIVCSKRYLEYMYTWPDYSITRYTRNWPENKKQIRCWAGRLYSNINSNGDIYPCFNMINDIKPLNCLKLGFKEAFENTSKTYCEGCTASSYNEQNLMFSLDFGVILNTLRMMK